MIKSLPFWTTRPEVPIPQMLRTFDSAVSGLAILLLSSISTACANERVQHRERTLVAAISSDPGHLNPAITTNGGVHFGQGLSHQRNFGRFRVSI